MLEVRNYSIDILRFLSICAVVMIHVWSMIDPLRDSSYVAHLLADVSRWCVPVCWDVKQAKDSINTNIHHNQRQWISA